MTVTPRALAIRFIACAALGLLLLSCALLLLSCASMPPPSHVLVVRHPELKCALIAFSGCPPREEPDPEAWLDDDAGVLDDAGVD